MVMTVMANCGDGGKDCDDNDDSNDRDDGSDSDGI
jgi:hypothetical protein